MTKQGIVLLLLAAPLALVLGSAFAQQPTVPGATHEYADVNSITILFDRELRDDADQQKASQYMLMFRTPQAEQNLVDKNFRLLDSVFLTPGVKEGYFTEIDRKTYLHVWSQRGLTGGLNYYRAAHIGPPTGDDTSGAIDFLPGLRSYTVHVPTLVTWGMKDPYLLPGNLKGLDKFVPNLTIKEIPDADHWVTHQKPELVNGYIRDFIEKAS